MAISQIDAGIVLQQDALGLCPRAEENSDEIGWRSRLVGPVASAAQFFRPENRRARAERRQQFYRRLQTI